MRDMDFSHRNILKKLKTEKIQIRNEKRKMQCRQNQNTNQHTGERIVMMTLHYNLEKIHTTKKKYKRITKNKHINKYMT
jgi:hypothetical protein